MSGSGLLTATALDVCTLNCGETGIDSRMDTGLAVAALGVHGRGRLTATSHIVQRACSLPAEEIGVTASGYTLSQVALVIASGHSGDYLPLLPARGQKSQDGWPDVKHRRVLRRLSLSLLLFLKCRGSSSCGWRRCFLSSLPSVLQDLARFFFVPFRILFPGSDLRYCGWGCAVCWVLVPLCPSTSAAGVVTCGAATEMPAGAGGPPAACCCAWHAWSYAASGGFPLSWGSVSLVQWWVRLVRRVTGGGSLRLCFLLVGREVLPVFLGFSRFWTRFFFRPLLVAPSLEAPQSGSACFCG